VDDTTVANILGVLILDFFMIAVVKILGVLTAEFFIIPVVNIRGVLIELLDI
jgi:hypothetical protein